MEIKIFLWFGVQHDRMRMKNNARTSKFTSLGIPRDKGIAIKGNYLGTPEAR
jgi:hypothetical protein